MPDEKIYIAGHRGMVGSAIVRRLKKIGCTNIVTRTHKELDLLDQEAVFSFFRKEKIDRVVLAAARVGGIHANNSYPAEFIYQNLMIQANVIHGAWRSDVEHLLFLGSSCIYPKFAPQPMKEEYLLTDVLEPTNEPYAIAKIAGIKMCESYNRQYGTCYRSVMPTNLFGPGDNYHLENSHVIPAMIRKFYLAKMAMEGDVEGIVLDEKRYGPIPPDICESMGYRADTKTLESKVIPRVRLWGTGSPRREFLHVDDMAAASVFVMGLEQSHFENGNPSFLNVGTGEDITIRETAEIICRLVGFRGETVYNPDQPDGTPRKLMDTGRINSLGWRPSLSFEEGLKDACSWYMDRHFTNSGESEKE
ncbi:GDP-L-fucose synthase family protein [Desulfomarina profundi]|uniref:GDP-L-fucose synthase family protein n=1 Tax=Desulfomarina profundi TaxID=2772557 RepID=UPI001E3026B9